MCKIKDLDRNEVYSLEEIKKDEVKFDMLKEWLKENDIDWTDLALLNLSRENYIRYSSKENQWVCGEWAYKSTKCALTLFDLDITDYQVDCTELSEVEINNLAEIVKSKGYEVWDNESSLIPDKGNGSNNFFKYDGENYYIGIESNKTTITYDKFIELFGEKAVELIETNHSEDAQKYALSTEQGYKESENKCNYELDFEFIKDLAMRIQNEPKYEPYNWQKPMDVEQLSNAMLRHAIEVKKGNFDDNGELGHLLAVAANAMFIYHQKKHHND